MAKMKKVPDYLEWALSLKPGQELVVKDNFWITDKQGNNVGLFQIKLKGYEPSNNELGAKFIIQNRPIIMEHFRHNIAKTLPTVRVKSTKTKLEYQVGICWPNE